MWGLVQLAMRAVLGTLSLVVLLWHDAVSYLLRSRNVQKCWEEVLGERVLFVELEGGRWQWRCRSLNVNQDPTVRYRTLQDARLASASMIYAFFVVEEVTSETEPPSLRPSLGSLPLSSSPFQPPTQGGEGG